MARVNIYIPDKLHEKMKQHDWVNWSRIAREAFKAHLAKTHPDAITAAIFSMKAADSELERDT
jgi:post-segregation antitoxin (ccd killing protein)